MTTRLAIRCCCRPQKILGYMDVDDARPYAEITVPLLPDWVPMPAAADAVRLRFVVTPFQHLTIAVGAPHTYTRERSLALKGEHVDPAQLARIRAFVPALPDGSPADGVSPPPPAVDQRTVDPIEHQYLQGQMRC